jgi:hypothetical protein
MIGYVLGNVKSCCERCNTFKWNLSLIDCIRKSLLMLGFINSSDRVNITPDIKYGEQRAKLILGKQKQHRDRKSHFSHKPELLLSLEEVCDIIVKPCHYCEQIDMRKPHGKSKIKIPANGIDRINSLGNYEKNNVLSCCNSCNSAKNDYDYSEFYLTAWGIYKNLSETVKYLTLSELQSISAELSDLATTELRLLLRAEIDRRGNQLT